MDLREKVVVITGASAGIGAASAAEFAKRGAHVVMVSRNAARLDQVREKLTGIGRMETVPCDISDKRQVARMVKTVLGRFGSADVLVNNAGFAIYGAISRLSIKEIEDQMRTNYFGMVYCTKGFLPGMLREGVGHIVNVASVAASMGLPGMASYCASKHAMLGFSEGLKYELQGTGVGVTVVSPIMVRTSFFDHPSFHGMSARSRYSISAQQVAAAVVRAVSSPRLEITVPAVARGAIWLKQTLPYLVNPVVGSSFRRMLDAAERDGATAPGHPEA